MKRFFILMGVLILMLSGCADKSKEIVFGIDKYPTPLVIDRGKLDVLPVDENNITWRVDVRGADLSALQLHDQYEDIQYATFDSNTKWPNALPENFSPSHIMELGKDPGLGLSALHEQGITGEGVSVAIIDQPLLVTHKEYKDRIKIYEELNIKHNISEMHGPAVASILAGESVGVAPKANIYYIAAYPGTFQNGSFAYDFSIYAEAIRRILDINEVLPDKDKIRVISISVGWDSTQKGYSEINRAVEEAKRKNILVVSSVISETHGYKFHGLGREIDRDPNLTTSFEPGLFWADYYFMGKSPLKETLLIPMDSRTTASPTGDEDYSFYRAGGWSWSIPYIAGLYALGCQVDRNLDPETFWDIALTTGDTIEISHNDETYAFGKIVNPKELILGIQNRK